MTEKMSFIECANEAALAEERAYCTDTALDKALDRLVCRLVEVASDGIERLANSIERKTARSNTDVKEQLPSVLFSSYEELKRELDAKRAQLGRVSENLCATCKYFQGGACIVCSHGDMYKCAVEKDFAILREEVETLREQLGASLKELEEARKGADQYDALLVASHEETMEARRNLLEYELLLDCVSSCNDAFQKKHASSLERRVSTIVRSYVKGNVRPYSPKESD